MLCAGMYVTKCLKEIILPDSLHTLNDILISNLIKELTISMKITITITIYTIALIHYYHHSKLINIKDNNILSVYVFIS